MVQKRNAARPEYDRAVKHLQCLLALIKYTDTQRSKGLVETVEAETSAGKPRRITYSTHWGFHRKVMLPEMERIVKDYRLRLRVEVSVERNDDTWELLEGDLSWIPKDAYVRISLSVYWIQEIPFSVTRLSTSWQS